MNRNFSIIVRIIIGLMALASVMISGLAIDIGRFSFFFQVFLLGCGIFFSLLAFEMKGITRKQVVVIVILLLCMIVTVINSGDNLFRCIYKMLLLLGLIGTAKYARRIRISFLEIIFAVYTLICIVSFLGFLLVNFCDLETLAYPVTSMVNGFFGIYYYDRYLYRYVMGIRMYRFAGIFWEPGLYGCYSSLALLYCLLFRNRRGSLALAVFYFVSNLFTLSVTAISVSMFLVAFSLLKNKHLKSIQRRMIGLVFVSAALILSMIIFKYKSGMPTYIINRGVSYNSWKTRWMDLVVSISIFAQNLPLGVGYYNTEPFEKAFNELIGYPRTGSNGLANWLFQTGVPGMVYMVMPFVVLFKKKNEIRFRETVDSNNKAILLVVAFAVLIMINMSEPMFSLPIMLWVMAYVYDESVAILGRTTNVKAVSKHYYGSIQC